MATIGEFEVVDHGIEHGQYFRGCGTSFTSFNYVQTGAGATFAEAYVDVCEQIVMCDDALAMREAQWTTFHKRVLKAIGRRTFPKRPAVNSRHSDEHYYYVSIRYNHAD